MDPKASLTEQLELATEIVRLIDRAPVDDRGDLSTDVANQVADLANGLAELVLTLDEWRQRGGFDPYRPHQAAEADAWRRFTTALQSGDQRVDDVLSAAGLRDED